MSAASPPAYVALPISTMSTCCAPECRGQRVEVPRKTKLTVKKYVLMGSVIMANVKLINFQMTEL